MMALSVLIAFLLDKVFSEPKSHHPLVYFGQLVSWLESRLNITQKSRISGVIGVLLAVVPLVFASYLFERALLNYPIIHTLASGLVLYVTVGWQSLLTHAKAIQTPLSSNDLNSAQAALAMIVSRDTQELNENDIAKAATESVLENGADAIFSAVFWFCLLGIPGVVLYRLSNTLDAMWGYKNPQYFHFGWCAARFDDALNFIPARLTALTYALMGNFSIAMRCWKEQGLNWKSPNAGPVMAAGAGALNTSLGGQASYHGEMQQRATLGPEPSEITNANAQTIGSACDLINRSLALWILVIIVNALV